MSPKDPITTTPLSQVDTERRIDGLTFEEYCNKPSRVTSDATADGLKGEPYVHYHMTKGCFNGKKTTRYKPLNNGDLYEYAKRKYAKENAIVPESQV